MGESFLSEKSKQVRAAKNATLKSKPLYNSLPHFAIALPDIFLHTEKF